MQIIAVDDEKMALERLVSTIGEVQPDAKITGFRSPKEALCYVAQNPSSVAFLDIEMREMDGITLAKQMKVQSPQINIIFTTGYSDYTGDAFAIHASGYVMKPVTPEKLRLEITDLRHPVANHATQRLWRHTFGHFDVDLAGTPVHFQYF